jgi:prepilin peptidase dependent protein B
LLGVVMRTGSLRRHQRGLSLVELMVGLCVGLFIVATATFSLTTQLQDHRRLMLSVQLEQDLRAAADVVARDLRRSGYWQHADTQLASRGAADNPYTLVTGGDGGSDTIAYAYSQDAAGHEDDTVDPDDSTGLKLEGGALKLLLGSGGWQSLTDTGVVRITAFRLSTSTRSLALDAYCANPCPPPKPGSAPCPPRQELREIEIDMSGTSPTDPSVVRSIHATVRLRNDRLVGHCG